jgi:hypothetical protein
MFQWVSGVLPFSGGTAAQVFHKLSTSDAQLPVDIACSGALRDVIFQVRSLLWTALMVFSRFNRALYVVCYSLKRNQTHHRVATHTDIRTNVRVHAGCAFTNDRRSDLCLTATDATAVMTSEVAHRFSVKIQTTRESVRLFWS